MRGMKSRDPLLLVMLVLPVGCAQLAAKVGGLSGASWQLVRIEGGDDNVVVPDDKIKVHARLRQRR